MSIRWTAGLVAVLIGVAACGDGTSSSSSSTSGSPSSPSSTIAATSTTSAVPASAAPGPVLPDQAVLPVMLFVNGIVYDLAEVPAPEIIDIGQSSLPYAGPPVFTEEGLLVATGESYDATAVSYTHLRAHET